MSRITIKWEGPAHQSVEIPVFGVPVRLEPGETIRVSIGADGKWTTERFMDPVDEMPAVQS